MKKHSPVIILIGLIILTSGCVRSLCVNGLLGSHKGKIKQMNELSVIEEFKEYIVADTVLTVAHQLGNYKMYPKQYKKDRKKEFYATREMKKCFDTLEITGIFFHYPKYMKKFYKLQTIIIYEILN